MALKVEFVIAAGFNEIYSVLSGLPIGHPGFWELVTNHDKAEIDQSKNAILIISISSQVLMLDLNTFWKWKMYA